MADNSAIEWTDATWNPTTGCDRVSPGCDNCYALRLAKRLKAMGNNRYQADGSNATSGPGFGLTVHDDLLARPASWRKGRRIFVNSMSDLFHSSVPTEFIKSVLRTMEETPQHTYQVLTKRANRLVELDGEVTWPKNLWLGVSQPAISAREPGGRPKRPGSQHGLGFRIRYSFRWHTAP